MGTTVLKGMVPAGIRAGYPIAIFNAQRRLKFGFPYTLDDSTPWTPQDSFPRLPRDRSNVYRFAQSTHYAPGTFPQGKTIEKRRFESYAPAGTLIPASEHIINPATGDWLQCIAQHKNGRCANWAKKGNQGYCHFH